MLVVMRLATAFAVMMCQVYMPRPSVWSQLMTEPRGSVVVIKGDNDKNVLVVRITAEGNLTDSKPCCMCINLMKWHGIKKVYYSDSNGCLCCLKLNNIDNETEIHASHGLKLMILRCNCNGNIATKKLPLTKTQKNFILKLVREAHQTDNPLAFLDRKKKFTVT